MPALKVAAGKPSIGQSSMGCGDSANSLDCTLFFAAVVEARVSRGALVAILFAHTQYNFMGYLPGNLDLAYQLYGQRRDNCN